MTCSSNDGWRCEQHPERGCTHDDCAGPRHKLFRCDLKSGGGIEPPADEQIAALEDLGPRRRIHRILAVNWAVLEKADLETKGND
jgi:hypothetical protein